MPTINLINEFFTTLVPTISAKTTTLATTSIARSLKDVAEQTTRSEVTSARPLYIIHARRGKLHDLDYNITFFVVLQISHLCLRLMCDAMDIFHDNIFLVWRLCYEIEELLWPL